MKRISGFIPLLISLTVFNMAAARAQSAASNKAPATIAGRVTLDGAGAQGAHVMLKPYVNDGFDFARISFGVEQPPALGAVTDAEGRYRITDVASGAYRISVFAPAYALEGEGDPLTPGKAINVAEGDNVENMDLSLTRGAVITGKVTDDKDRPVIAAPVNVYKLNVYGRRRPFDHPYSAFMIWETDDRGVYRIFGLEAGRYLVAAGFDPDKRKTGVGYRHTFHPDAADEEQARVVEVESGGEAANVDIKVAALAKGYVVTGRVVDADSGEPVPGVTVSYQGGFGAGRPVTNALGEFRFENLPPNSYRAYVINIDPQGRGAYTYGEEIKFEVVDSDVSGLEIRTSRGATISGVVAIEGSNDPALRAKLAQVSLFALGGSRPIMISRGAGGNGTISPNGTFKLSNVQPGKTRIITGFDAPKGFALLRYEHNGVEIKEFDVNSGDRITGVRLVFAYGAGVIAGRVEVKGGSLPVGARMGVSCRREGATATVGSVKSAEVDGRGQFLFEGLAQGTYKLSLRGAGAATVEQIVTVAGEGRHEVTFIVDLAAKEKVVVPLKRQTDDRGVYRWYGLAPGSYIVCAGGSMGLSTRPTPFEGRMLICHPSTTRDAAAEVTVRGGEEVSGIDIRYRIERGYIISGKITGLPATGGPAQVVLRKAGSDLLMATTSPQPGGVESGYAIYGAPNGEYEIIAARDFSGDENAFASSPRRVVVNGRDVGGIDLALAPLAALAGRVTVEKAARKCEAARDSRLNEIVVRARRDEPGEKGDAPPSPFWSQPSGEANEVGAFSIRGLKAGRYRLETHLPGADWYVKEMRLGGAPITSGDLARNGVTLKSGERLSGATIILGEGAAGLKGKVVAEGDARLPARMLALLAPAEPDARDEALRFVEARVESDGLFSFGNLAPGKYWLLARPIPDFEPNDKPARPVAWDTAERAKLRREAEAANIVIELKPCQRVSDYALRYGKWKMIIP